MKKKLIITESQYEKLIKNINEDIKKEPDFKKIDNIFNLIAKSSDTSERTPIPNWDKYFFEKNGDKITMIRVDSEYSLSSYVFNLNEPERLKTRLLNIYYEFNKGENLKPSKFDTEKIKGNHLKVGDIYFRKELGVLYVFKLLEKIRPRDKRFYIAPRVEVLHVGSEAKTVRIGMDGYEFMGYDVGDIRPDFFKNMNAGYDNNVVFGDVIKILNWPN